MLNEIFILQILIICTLLFFINIINIITLWYLAGIYLLSLGFLLLLDDADIFVGFLWVIDFGVGLIFFIFILHFSNFLYQKSLIDLTARYFYYYPFLMLFFLFFFFINNPVDSSFNAQLQKTWFFYTSWYDFYEFYHIRTVTGLNLMREVYFYINSLGFFIINFMIFYGIFGCINFCFSIKRVFGFLNLSQIKNFKLLNEVNSGFFIRTQNFIRQQNTSTGARVWIKHKNFSF